MSWSDHDPEEPPGWAYLALIIGMAVVLIGATLIDGATR